VGTDAVAEVPAGPVASGRGPVRSDALIDEAGKESFPASDPPATWSGVDRRDMDTDVVVEAAGLVEDSD
jgi:hypothetical protein